MWLAAARASEQQEVGQCCWACDLQRMHRMVSNLHESIFDISTFTACSPDPAAGAEHDQHFHALLLTACGDHVKRRCRPHKLISLLDVTFPTCTRRCAWPTMSRTHRPCLLRDKEGKPRKTQQRPCLNYCAADGSRTCCVHDKRDPHRHNNPAAYPFWYVETATPLINAQISLTKAV